MMMEVQIIPKSHKRYFPNAINSKKLILIEGEHLGTSQARNIV